MERRSYDADIAEIKQRVKDLERRCDVKEDKLSALEAFQNKAIGYALAASAIATFVAQYLNSK